MTENTTTQHPTTAGPRRLTRPHEGRVLGGVCAAVADYTGVDVTVVRLVTVASCLFGLAGVALYVVGLLLIPEA
jgi:phage shock protein C